MYRYLSNKWRLELLIRGGIFLHSLPVEASIRLHVKQCFTKKGYKIKNLTIIPFHRFETEIQSLRRAVFLKSIL